MGHIRDCVQEFHEAFGHLVFHDPAIPPEEIIFLRRSLIREEIEETVHSMEKGSTVGIVDGVCDILYVVAGTSLCFGVPLNEPDDIDSNGLSEFPTLSMIHTLISVGLIVDKAIVDFHREGYKDHLSLKVALDLLTFVSIQITSSLGLEIKELFDEVHRSNMDKLGPDGKPIYREDKKVLKPEGWEPPNLIPIIEKQIERKLNVSTES